MKSGRGVNMSKRASALTFLALALSVGLANIGPATTSAAGAVAVRGEIGFFYDALAPYGSWVDVATYGDVWVPRVPTWWRPYSDGHWVFTDDGWCWVDDEPWGWATFHYGRWYFDDDYGWAWVPGTVWAPAWVAWRHGDGFIGWAPLPPQIGWRAGFGLAFAGGDFDAVIAPHFWCFVDERHFGAPAVRGYLAPPARNVTFVRATRNITSYTVVNNRVFNRGVDVRQIERITGRAVPRMRIVDRNVPGAGRVVGHELNVYRPSVTAGAARWRGPQVQPPINRGVVMRPRAVERPHTESLRRFDTHWNQERTRLQQLHSQDAAKTFKGVSPNELRLRHEAERQAFAREQQRERRVLDRRLQPNTGAHVSKGKVVEHRVPQNTGANAKGSKGKGKGGGGTGHD